MRPASSAALRLVMEEVAVLMFVALMLVEVGAEGFIGILLWLSGSATTS
jgi:hypothetical protein